MPERVTLTYMSGPEDGRVVDLVVDGSSPEVTFGRVPSCTICLSQDPDTSRRHSRIQLHNAAWWLEDLGSTNGTFLGEFAQAERIAGPVRVSPGQVFRVGQTRFRLEASDRQDARTEAHATTAERM